MPTMPQWWIYAQIFHMNLFYLQIFLIFHMKIKRARTHALTRTRTCTYLEQSCIWNGRLFKIYLRKMFESERHYQLRWGHLFCVLRFMIGICLQRIIISLLTCNVPLPMLNLWIKKVEDMWRSLHHMPLPLLLPMLWCPYVVAVFAMCFLLQCFAVVWYWGDLVFCQSCRS